MSVLSGKTNFDPFLKTWNFFTSKFPMKYSKNGQNFTTPENTWNVIFGTCWTPCKKPNFSMWPWSRNTFFDLPLISSFTETSAKAEEKFKRYGLREILNSKLLWKIWRLKKHFVMLFCLFFSIENSAILVARWRITPLSSNSQLELDHWLISTSFEMNRERH